MPESDSETHSEAVTPDGEHSQVLDAATEQIFDEAVANLPVMTEYFDLQHQYDLGRDTLRGMIRRGWSTDEDLARARTATKQRRDRLHSFVTEHADALRAVGYVAEDDTDLGL